MTHDEQRKKIFELECALGAAIKVAEEARDGWKASIDNYNKLSKSMEALSIGINSYIRTMDKKYLHDAVELAKYSLLK